MKLSSQKLQRGKTIELQMTSMIDVVFLLLIFFMTTAAFVKTERNLDSAIKVKNKSAVAARADFEPAIVDVVSDGERFVYKMGSRKMTSQDELVALLRRMENKGDGAVVQVSDEAPYHMAVAAVQACKSAGFGLVSYVPLAK